jgi:hypothetical protein
MRRLAFALAVVASLAGQAHQAPGSTWVRPKTIAAQNECQTFPETGKSVCGIFLSYWRANGGLAQQGYPISDVFKEISSNGREYDTQYFERAVFEHHPENAGTRYEVLLALLGSEKYEAKYPAGVPGEGSVQIGQTLVLPGEKPNGTFRLTVLAVDERAELPYGYSGEGPPNRASGKFVVISLRAENLGSESDSIHYRNRLKDSRGRLSDLVETSVHRGAEKLLNRKPYSETLQPGIPTEVAMVFDVAMDATTFTLVPRQR